MQIKLSDTQKNNIIRNILKEGSYLMYEFKDSIISFDKDKFGHEYKKSISPLYNSDVIDNYDNQTILDIILSNVPYYYLKPSLSIDEEHPFRLNINRDAGLLNVPSSMHQSFWFTWFRDAFSDIQNNLILDVYNKMRYPIVNENHYLNAKLFPRLASEAFEASVADDNEQDISNSKISFKYTYDDDIEDIKNGDRGCLTYLDGIVNQKLQAIYSLIGYNPDQSELLSSWAESQYMSGAMDETAIISEKSIFRLQDIQYELLRRKFAGSSTLYMLTLASIDKRGSFIGAIPAGRLMADAINKFKDQRLIRVINIPGILSTYVDMSDNHPFDIFYKTPLEEHNKYIPLGIVTPLFYTSASWEEKSPIAFYKSGIVSKALPGDKEEVSASQSPEKYRSKFLRDNSRVIDWSVPTGIISSRAVNTFFPRLDMDSSGNYKTLDSKYKYEDPNDPLHVIEVPMALDIAQAFFSTRSISANFLDINADRIMYHSNIIQKELGNQYKFPIYHIAEGNSLSLMDTSWINYMKSATEYKSKIQDDILYGVQVSNYQALNNTMQLIPRYFFGISYGINDYFEDYYEYDHFKDDQGNIIPPRYAFIWYCYAQYNAENYKIVTIKNTLMSRVTLPINSSRYDESLLGSYDASGHIIPGQEGLFNDFKHLPEYKELQQFSMGIIPLTYNIKSVDSMHLGPYESKSSGKNSGWAFSDDITLSNYNKVAFAFSDNPSISDRSFFQKAPEFDDEGNNITEFYFDSNVIYDGPTPAIPFEGISPEPTKNTKVVYYVVDRIGHDNKGHAVHRYIWSEPLRVFALNEMMTDIEKTCQEGVTNYEIRPDWQNLQYYFNPYLNFTQNSASPVRHKNLIPSIGIIKDNITPEFQKKICLGPSEAVGIVSLACERNKNYLCNDTGNLYSYFKDGVFETSEIGYYLERVHPEIKEGSASFIYAQANREYVKIYGDNRTEDVYDGSGDIQRTKIYSDELHNLGLNFKPGNYIIPAQIPYNKIAYNFFRICPFDIFKYVDINNNVLYNDGKEDHKLDLSYDEVKSMWAWEKPTKGFSLYLRFKLDNQVNNPLFTQETICLMERRAFNETPDGEVDSEFSIRLHREDPIETFENKDKEYPKYRYKIRFEFYHVGSNKICYFVESPIYSLEDLMSSPVLLTANVSSETIDPNTVETIIRLIINSKVYESKYKAINNKGVFNIEVNNILDSTLSEQTTQVAKANKVSYNPDFNYDLEPGSFVPGYPIKYWKGCGYKLDYIYVASSVDGEVRKYGDEVIQKNMFFGQIYDIRLYNAPENILVTLMRNSGSLREMYSHSPTSYKLAQSIYNDIGYFKQFKLRDEEDADNIPIIKTIRLLSRSVWDTIMVDEYPVTEPETSRLTPQFRPDWANPEDDYDIYDEEGNTHVITQDLILNGEVVNNRNPDATFIKAVSYKNKTYELNNLDRVSLVTTSLYPVFYENHLFESKGSFLQSAADGDLITLKTESHIYIPARAVGDTLKYSSDFDLNFIVSKVKHLDNYYSRGSNIELIYNDALKAPSIRLKSSAVKSSQNNHVVIPMTIPIQRLSMGTEGYLDGLMIRDFQLASNFSIMLRSQTYYSEMMIPVTFQESLTSEPYFKPKWIAIRSLREGTYYFTVKYPIQFLPFLDFDKNTTLSSKYASLYASARFKIEVKGTPKKYNEKENEIKGRPVELLKNNIRNTLTNGDTLYKSNDNRTYPHRIIDIDLYAMGLQGKYAGLMQGNTEAYNFSWKKLASNHPSDEEKAKGIILLDSEGLKNPLVIRDEIQLFFSKNYTSPFFIAKYEKGEDPTKVVADSADDDLISPIQILPNYSETNIQLEKLQATYEDDLDDLCMVAGRSYKLLFDYSAKVTEISYTDKYFTNNFIITDDEKVNYTRLINVNENDISPQDYSYTTACPWYTTKDLSFNKTSGFDTLDNDWAPICENWLPECNTDLTYQSFNENLSFANGDYLRLPVNVKYVDMTPEEILAFEKASGWSLEKIPSEVIIHPEDDSKEYIPYKLVFNMGEDVLYQNEYGIWNLNGIFGPNETKYISNNKDILYFGNPYSRSSSSNYLYKLSNNNRFAIDNLAYFPYVLHGVPSNEVYPGQYKNSMEVIENRFATQRSIEQSLSPYTLSSINDFPEVSVVASVWKIIYNNVINTINSIVANPYGLFQTLSTISPKFDFTVKTTSGEVTKQESIIMSQDYDLYAYTARDTKVPSKNPNIIINRRGVYTNNLLRSQDFKDSSKWISSYPCDYVPDNDWDNKLGKDVLNYNWGIIPKTKKSEEIEKDLINMGYDIIPTEDENQPPVYSKSLKLMPQKLPQDEPIILNYIGGFRPYNTEFETAISLKSDDINNIMVYCRYYFKGEFKKEIRLRPSQFSQESKKAPFTRGAINLALARQIDAELGVDPYIEDNLTNVDEYDISKDLINNRWYVFSNETKEKIEADDIEYEFVYSPYTYRRFMSCLKIDPYVINLDNLPKDIKYYDMQDIRDYMKSFIEDSVGSFNVSVDQSTKDFSMTFINGDVITQHYDGTWEYKEDPNPEKTPLINILANIPIDSEDTELHESVNLKVTKAVVRSSKTASHCLGLSDVLKPISTTPEEAEVIILSHPILLFKNKEEGNIVPFQFDNKCKNRMASNNPDPGKLTFVETSQIETQDFIRQYIIDNNKQTFMKKLLKPWVRRIYFWDKWESTDDAGVFQNNRVIFYPYVIQTDSMGLKHPSIIKTPVHDVFNITDTEDPKPLPGMFYDETDGSIHINSLIVDKNSEALRRFGNDIKLYEDEPITLADEKFTALSNCFHPEKFKMGMSSPIAITNIQLISDKTSECPDGRILYEYEYFPIIYDENTQHISINLYLHKAADQQG